MTSKTRRAEPPIPSLNHRGARNLTWMELAACQEAEPQQFFPETPGNREARVNKVTATYCQHCPVIEQCYEYGLAIKANSGIFGGIEFISDEANYARKYRARNHA